MTLKLKTRLTLVMTLLVVAVLTIVFSLGMVNFTQALIRQTDKQGQLISKQVSAQVRQALGTDTRIPPPQTDTLAFIAYLREVLSMAPGLTSLLESTSTYSPTIIYLAVTDANNIILAHHNTSLLGTRLPTVEPFANLSNASPLRQLKILYRSEPSRNFDVAEQMFDPQNNLVAIVRVTMNTALIRQELNDYMRKNLTIMGLALLTATTLAALLSTLLLNPLAFISAGIERMVKGEFGKPIRLSRRDELGMVSLGLNELGQKLEVNREEIDTLKGNIGQIVKGLE